MDRPSTPCAKCGTAKDGVGRYCVLCYSKMLFPCGACMVQVSPGIFVPQKKGKPPQPIDCEACRNERWILRED